MPALSIVRWVCSSGARVVESPNRDARPGALDPELIVVHGISLPPGRFGGPWIERLFMNTLPADGGSLFRNHPAPARVLARADRARRRAHAVRAVRPSRLARRNFRTGAGASACNDFSIGVELEGTDEAPYDERQYEALADLVAALQRAYPSLAEGWIAGHGDIAPGRKTDPGPAFDWRRLERDRARARRRVPARGARLKRLALAARDRARRLRRSRRRPPRASAS